METELFQVNLTKAQKATLLNRAAQLTIRMGKRVTMSDLLRSALEVALTAPINDLNGPANDSKLKSIRFVPKPSIWRALEQAQFNSGKPLDDVINEQLAEALQIEEVIA